VDDPVHTTDLFQTIVRIAQKTNSRGVDSVSLTPYLSSSSASAQHDTIYTEEFDTDTRTGSAAIRGAQYKIVTDVTYPDPESDCSAEFSYDVTGFYDLDADPHELDNLLGTGTARLPTEARSDAGCP
jgi:arylsulfatase A-like enzyme